MARVYTAEEVQRGLLALAMQNGSPRRAAKQLKADGLAIPMTTLAGWKRTKAPDYDAAVIQTRDRIWQEMSEGWKDVISSAQAGSLELVETARRLNREGELSKANSASAAAKNLALVGGISHDKSSLIESRPTSITHNERSLPELMATIAREFGDELFPGLKDSPLLESTAEEITEPLPKLETMP